MAAESTVAWLKRPMGTVYSFLLPVTGTARISEVRVRAAATGLRFSVRTLRAARMSSPSVPTIRPAAATVTSGGLVVQFQNDRTARAFWPSRPADCECDQH